MKFIADVMVGKLARWLRILGFDVAYSNKFEDDELLRIAERENRIILTRDRGLVSRRMSTKCLLIASDNYKEQVREVIAKLNLEHFEIFSRCIECNAELQQVDKEDVFERVPPFVYLTQERFAICSSCRRVYWHGTHAAQILKQLSR
jgi:uncharacterized protein with PIN domain